MDLFPERRHIMDDSLESVTVVDVYDQAAGIGKEFEKLIESYGVDAVTDLMPKVIKALEQLESLAGRYEKESSEISELRYTIDKLENEKRERAQERHRYEEELLQIEDNWQRETKDLLKAVSNLQEENKRLQERLVDTKQAVAEEVEAVTRKTEEKEIEVLTKLKETVDKQREELRKFKTEAKHRISDCEALQSQLDQIVKVNADLRRSNSIQKKQAHTLLEEKSELEAQLADKEQQITKITQMIKEQDEIQTQQSTASPQPAHPSLEVEEDEVPIPNEVSATISSEKSQFPPGAPPVGEDPRQEEGENMGHIEHRLSMIGKMVIDMKDPDRPRFTMKELKTVLMERNELKSKLIEVEEELTAYKPKTPRKNTNSSTDNEYQGEDLPVEGPINKEPEEKVYPGRRKPSGIRKFFTELVEKLNLPEVDF
ncbi:RILP-like protein 1 isoform X2 [Saccostrea echinata]|uniref:RILP-like protein 1 isoform X2 n=1 Tax=Saccostrea echinata TaxID=191078 RepID=UPI002A7ED270|nr:RILP-like protein 1 isoform X2 [Saccostrea echinata]